MMRLLKLCVALVAFIAICWFGATVKLGSRTLFAHLRAIADTKESQELVDGTKQAAEPLVDDVRRRIGGHGAADAGAAPQENLTAEDRRRLRKLLDKTEVHAANR